MPDALSGTGFASFNEDSAAFSKAHPNPFHVDFRISLHQCRGIILSVLSGEVGVGSFLGCRKISNEVGRDSIMAEAGRGVYDGRREMDSSILTVLVSEVKFSHD